MTAASPFSSMTSRPTHSCIRCADRKVKCDRQKPCGACVRHNVECLFSSSQPSRRSHRRNQDQVLVDRLRQYEDLLREHGIDSTKVRDTPKSDSSRNSNHRVAEDVPEVSQMQTPSSIRSDTGQRVNKTQILHDKGRFQFVDK